MPGPAGGTVIPDEQPSTAEHSTNADRTTETSDRVIELEERISDLEAAVKAIEAYVGHIERVDQELEQRADAALAAVDRLESRVDDLDNERATADQPSASLPEEHDPSDQSDGIPPKDEPAHATGEQSRSPATEHSIIDDESGLIERLRGQL